VVWNLLHLRAEALTVSYLDDSSIHEQMVRFAAVQFRTGHLPLTSWFPYLGLGSPQFLHYQSLPAMVTGLIGLLISPDSAFHWTLYILLSAWPISVFLCARLFAVDRWAAAASAAMAPFLMGAVGVGYEQNAYVWVGFGVWAQLWASLTLPLAWGLSWRAIRDGRGLFAAVTLVSLTMALHFETGYLAMIPLVLWPFVSRRPIMTRVRRSAAVVCGSLLAAAWVIVPLIEERNWAATNEILRNTPLVNGYGASRVLGWLVSGRLLDAGRLPVVTVFAGIGLALACGRWRKDENGRALVFVFVACLLLSFGRTTFGTLVDVIPGSANLFFRRFMMGAQLAALLFAGTGAIWCWRVACAAVARWTPRRGLAPGSVLRGGLARAAVAAALGVAVLAPAWTQLDSYDARNASAIEVQRHADRAEGAQLSRLIAVVQRDGGGRVYAGMPSNWGADFTVGAVPVFKYLESKDVDEVGYTLRTTSLMTGPEYYFDERNAGNYSLFGIHYLILPAGRLPPIRAHPVLRVGRYALWTAGSVGYIHVGRIVGGLQANHTDLGVRSVPLLHSRLARDGDYLRVAFGGPGGATRPLPRVTRRASVGSVISEADDLRHGRVTTTVRMREPGVVVLSSSFDGGWTATVDGHSGRPEMVAPALTGIAVPAGAHTVAFRYQGFADYLPLFVLCGLTLTTLAALDLVRRRKTRQGATSAGG
jgi:hypothetical protein